MPSAEGLNGDAYPMRSYLERRGKPLSGVAASARSHDARRGPRQLAAVLGRRLAVGESAFTLIELLISAAIFAVALTAILALLDSANQTGYKDQERNTALNEETNGIQRMLSDLGQAYQVNGPVPVPSSAGSDYIDVDVRLVESGAQVDRRVAYICNDPNLATGLDQCDRYEDPVTDGSDGWPLPGSSTTDNPSGIKATLVVPRVVNEVTGVDANDPVFQNLASPDGTGSRPTYGLIAIKTPASGERYGKGAGNYTQNTVLRNSFYMRQLDYGH